MDAEKAAPPETDPTREPVDNYGREADASEPGKVDKTDARNAPNTDNETPVARELGSGERPHGREKGSDKLSKNGRVGSDETFNNRNVDSDEAFDNRNVSSYETFYALSIAWQLGFLIAVPIAVFAGLGLWLDAKFGSKPLFVLSGLGLGLLVTTYEVYHVMYPLIKRNER